MERTNLINTKDKLIDVLKVNGEYLNLNELICIAKYIEKYIDLPKLDNDYEYTLRLSKESKEIFKYKIIYENNLKFSNMIKVADIYI